MYLCSSSLPLGAAASFFLSPPPYFCGLLGLKIPSAVAARCHAANYFQRWRSTVKYVNNFLFTSPSEICVKMPYNSYTAGNHVSLFKYLNRASCFSLNAVAV